MYTPSCCRHKKQYAYQKVSSRDQVIAELLVSNAFVCRYICRVYSCVYYKYYVYRSELKFADILIIPTIAIIALFFSLCSCFDCCSAFIFTVAGLLT